MKLFIKSTYYVLGIIERKQVWPISKDFFFCFLPFSNYYTNTSRKEDLNLETLEVYSVDPYNPEN